MGTLFSPAADVTAGLCLAGAAWSALGVRAVLASVCLYAAGMVLNDHADQQEDGTHRPERPLPRGDIQPVSALALGLALLAASLTLAPSPAYYGVMAALVIGYDYLLKRWPAVGALTMGSVRGLNLAAGAVTVAGTHAIAEPRTVLTAALGYGLCIVSVTFLGIFEDAKTVNPRAVAGIQSVPPLVVVGVCLILPERWPTLAIAGLCALWFSRRVQRQGSDWPQGAIRAQMTWLLLGTMVYTSLLCLGSSRPIEAICIALAILPARWISRRIALT